MFVSRLLPLRGFTHAFALILGKFQHSNQQKAEGQISHMQGLTNALASTVGMGNIAGVAVAITQGGPGAIFWMWVAGILGMNTKFFECSLAQMYRGHDYRGEVQGGPMYVIERALPRSMRPLAIFFAVCGLIGTMTLFQINQLAQYAQEEFACPPIAVGVMCAILVGIILLGGIRRLAKVTEALVPSMCVLYVCSCLYILLVNASHVPGIFLSIFSHAFSGHAALGGAMGIAFIEVMKIGVKRAAFSNEAGIGTSPMAHSNVRTSEPISEGLVAMLEPFFDTIVVCTMTALVILVSLDAGVLSESDSGVLLTRQAFQVAMPSFGTYFLGLAVLLFSVTTMIGGANYNEKCWNYLFRGRWGLGRNTFICCFCASLVFGSAVSMDNVVNIIDIGFAFMAIPNLIATLFLARKVEAALTEYVAKYLTK